MDSIRPDIIVEARRVEQDCLYSAKGHFVAATIWGRVHYWIGVPAAVLATIAGASALSQFDNHNVVAGVLSLGAAALSAISTFLNPNAKAQAHANAGNRYNAVRNQARVFYQIDEGVS